MTKKNIKNIRIAGFYNKKSKNPYCQLFYQALSEHNVNFIYGNTFNDKWIFRQNDVQWLHVHWPEGFWRYSQGQIGGVLRGLSAFYFLLRKIKKKGLLLSWTVHNISHHEGVSLADRIGYLLLSRYSDLMICHSEYTKKEIVNRWKPKTQPIVMPHGNYNGIYPDPDPKSEIFNKLQLNPNLPVVSCIGVIREYKGIDIAVKSILRKKKRFQLLIAGKPHEDYKIGKLLSISQENENIVIIPESLSDKQLSNFYSITDIALFPYRKVTGSGALLTALTFGCAVVASDLPYFREIIGNYPNAGRLFKVGDSDALAEAINHHLDIPIETRCTAAINLANMYSWTNVVKPVAERFKTLAEKK